MANTGSLRLCRFILLLAVVVFHSFAQNITVRVGTGAAAPVSLVKHSDSWFFHKGTNAPATDWKTADDGALGTAWSNGSGGFGYADNANETSRCATLLSDMSGKYTTVYLRKSFVTTTTPDAAARLILTVDYDDAFVAYLDGSEIARSANVPGALGTEPLYSTNATSTHESSLGNTAPVNPPTVVDLGLVGNRLNPGTHVLSVLGLNQSSGSSDFILVADLEMTQPTAGAAQGGPILAIVGGSSSLLSGSNTVSGATRVHVNGDDAKFDPATQTWTKTNSLAPGVNKHFIAALDDVGNLLAFTNQIIVSEPAFTEVGGTLGANTLWTTTMGVIHVTNTVVIPVGGTLTIQEGTTLLMNRGANIVGTNATLIASGALGKTIYFLPADGTSTNWGGLIISGTSGAMTLDHVETIAGHVELFDGAVGDLRDSYFHDYLISSPAIVHTLGVPNRVTLNLQRCHIANYHEVLSQVATNHFSDCLLEYQDYSGDGIDFDFGQEGSYIRNCTVRRGFQFNTDAIDMGEYGPDGTHVLIDSCLLHDFVDKGVSMGVAVTVTVTNTLIYNVDAGFGVKDDSVAGIFNCTVANANYGIHAYNKANAGATTGGGHVTNSFNNIFWNITNAAVSLLNGSTAIASYSDFQGTNYAGEGNISADPLFINPAIRDFRLNAGSPALGAGLNGTNMGFTAPVGGIPATPIGLAVVTSGYEAPKLTWQDDADNEIEFRIERSTNGVDWIDIGAVDGNTTNYTDVNVTGNQKYYYRVFAENSSGVSDYSNIASATPKSVVVVSGGNVGGSITQDTVFDTGGTFDVVSSITVQPGATLTIKPGAHLLFGAGLNMTVANGGVLMAAGTETSPILFTRSGASGNWGNLTINGSVGSPESKLSYIHFDFNTVGGTPCIELAGGTMSADHLTFGQTASPYMHLDGGSFVVSDCVFPTATSAGGFELLHGTGGIKAGGRGIIRHNFFGSTTGYNDIIDFTGGNRPSPIIQFINNVFTGASDDMLDLDGTDGWVEGNIFLHAHKNGSPDTSSAVSGGNDSGQVSEVTIVGNLFFDCDQAATAKQGNFYTMLNNTIVHITHTGGLDTESGAINVADVGTTFAAGFYLEGNIVFDAPELVRNYDSASTLVTFTNNILSAAWTGPGGANSVVDPLLKHVPTVAEATFTNWTDAQIVWDWFSLQTASPAINSGPNGTDKGAARPIGVSIAGEPQGSTTDRNATLTVGFNRANDGIPASGWPNGSGYTAYKWRLDTNSWSPETPIATPIVLTNLASGPHRVEVVGKNDAGFYQDDPQFGEDASVTSSAVWTVEDSIGLEISSIASVPGEVHIHFMAVAGVAYTVEYKNDLNDATWAKLMDISAQVATGDYDVKDSAPASGTRFYRIVQP